MALVVYCWQFPLCFPCFSLVGKNLYSALILADALAFFPCGFKYDDDDDADDDDAKARPKMFFKLKAILVFHNGYIKSKVKSEETLIR